MNNYGHNLIILVIDREDMTHPSILWNRKLRRQLKKQFGGKCSWEDCPITSKLEFAHIKPTKLSGRGRGSKERMRDIRDNPTCYRLLCSYHHTIFDSTNVGLSSDSNN